MAVVKVGVDNKALRDRVRAIAFLTNSGTSNKQGGAGADGVAVGKWITEEEYTEITGEQYN